MAKAQRKAQAKLAARIKRHNELETYHRGSKRSGGFRKPGSNKK